MNQLHVSDIFKLVRQNMNPTARILYESSNDPAYTLNPREDPGWLSREFVLRIPSVIVKGD